MIKKIVQTIIKILDVTTIILCAVITVLTLYVFMFRVSGREAELFGYSVFKIITPSMQPTINVGDYIIVCQTDPELLKEGDIISFHSEQSEIYGKVNTHRIVGKDSDGNFITKGDASTENDGITVKSENIIGKYILKINMPGFLSEKNILIFAAVMFVIVAINETVVIVKTIKEDKESDGS